MKSRAGWDDEDCFRLGDELLAWINKRTPSPVEAVAATLYVVWQISRSAPGCSFDRRMAAVMEALYSMEMDAEEKGE